MRKKIFYILLIFFTLQSCGYTPLYSGLNKNNLKINIIEISGNDSMNEIVSLQLKRFSNNSSDNNKDLRVNTNYEKNAGRSQKICTQASLWPNYFFLTFMSFFGENVHFYT